MPLTLKWQHPACSCIAWTLHQPTQTSCQELQSLSLFPDSDRGASGLRGSRRAISSMAWVIAGSKLAIRVSKGASTRLAAVSEKLALNQETSHNLWQPLRLPH